MHEGSLTTHVKEGLFDLFLNASLPFGAVVTTCKNMVTRTKNKVTSRPARSPPFKGMKKLIQETTTNIAEGIINCKTKLKAFRSRMT